MAQLCVYLECYDVDSSNKTNYSHEVTLHSTSQMAILESVLVTLLLSGKVTLHLVRKVILLLIEEMNLIPL